MTLEDTMNLGGVLVKSGYFKDARDASQAVVKVLAGQEMGFGPIASMKGINIIQGQPSIGANLLGAAIKRTRKYNYRIVQPLTNERAEIAFFEDGQEVGRSIFTIEDAKQAGLDGKDNWKKWPRNMLFSRALSNGARWYCPDVFGGVTPYTPEELGAEVDDAGEIIDVTPESREWPAEVVRAGEDEPDPPSDDGDSESVIATSPQDLLVAVNHNTAGYYNHIKHMLQAYRKHTGNEKWSWPTADDVEGYNVAYAVLCEYAEANKAK